MADLRVVYSGIRQPTVDVVSIPGLPDLVPEYRVKDHKKWLRDVLSHQIPYARIMSYDYDFAKTATVASWQDLIDQVTRFLYALTHKREEEDQVHRPLVFICYSFGSIILKKALLIGRDEAHFLNIFINTKAILFLGCLHNEAHPEFEDLSLKCAAIEFRTTNKKHSIMEKLKNNNWPALKEVLASFRDLRLHIQIRSFCETRPSTFQTGRFFNVAKTNVVCPPVLSELSWPEETVIPVDMDHVQLSTFPDRTHDFFTEFMKTLKALMVLVFESQAKAESVSSMTVEQREDDELVHVDIVTGTEIADAFTDPLNSLSLFANQTFNLPCFVVAPHKQNPNFVAREEVTQKLHHTFTDARENGPPEQRTFAICGLGGMGKTSIAVDYVFRYRQHYRAVFWAHGENETKLTDSFSSFVEALGISVPKADHREAIHQWLAHTSENWLLVMDNVDSDDKHDLLRSFLPGSDRGSVLITSRDNSLLGEFEGIELGSLEPKPAADLLVKLARFQKDKLSEQAVAREMDAAFQVVLKIGCLPLGINQAATIMINDRCRISEFLEVYDNEDLIMEAESVKLVRPHLNEYPYSLNTVWGMNFSRLTPEQQSLLNIMSFCDPDRFQLRLLTNSSMEAIHPALQFLSTPKKVHKCKVALLNSSLVHENEDKEQESSDPTLESQPDETDASLELGLHRLVQAACQVRMTKVDRNHHFKLSFKLIKSAWPIPERKNIFDPKRWPKMQQLLPHVQSLCRYYVKSREDGEPLTGTEVDWEWPRLLYEAGWFCYERAMLSSMEFLLLPAKDYCMQHQSKGGGEIVLSDIYGGLGSLFSETNRLQETYDSFKAELDCARLAVAHGELESPSMCEVYSLGRMANGLQGLLQLGEAEVHYRQCLDMWNKLSGDQRIYRAHLATCLWQQGKLDEAEATIRPLVKDRHDMSSHRTGRALCTLGNIEIAQARRLEKDGKLEEAETIFTQAMSDHELSLKNYTTVLGVTHHKSADAKHKYAWHLHRQREYKRAEFLLREAIQTYSSDPIYFKNEIARTTYKLGCVLQDMGNDEDGRKNVLEAERLRKECMPPELWEPATSEDDYDRLINFYSK